MSALDTPDRAGAGGADALERRPEPTVPTRRERLLLVAATGGWALLCNALLDSSTSVRSWWVGAATMLHQPLGVRLLNVLVVWALLLALVALLQRLWLACALSLGGVLAVGLVHHEKLRLRREPLYPSDIAFADQVPFLGDVVGWPAVLTALLALVLLVTGVALALRALLRRLPDGPRAALGPWRPRTRVGVLLLALLAGFALHDFHGAANPVRASYDAAGAQWAPFSQLQNYRRNGFVAGFLYNADVPVMERPPGYSEERMAQIVARYQGAALAADDRGPSGGDAVDLADLDIVLVLGETFSDPTRVEGVRLAEDPIPLTRELMTRTTSGRLLTHRVGAGTANMEFEALTGLSMEQFAPQLTTPYQMLLPSLDSFPSAVSLLGDRAHGTLAVHPFGSGMYRRRDVYPRLGFDRAVFADDMRFTERLEDNDLISDDSAFREVEAALAAASDPLFVNLVTMQNHFPMGGKYADPVPVTGVSEQTARELGGYARGLRYTDEALHGFLSRLAAQDEPVAVVYYGDHTPSFWLGEAGVDPTSRTLHEAPFFLWSNVGDLPAEDLGVTSPVFLLPLLFDRLGLPLPPYYALLLAVHEYVPALAPGRFLTASGWGHEPRDLDEAGRQALEDYRLVQYDLTAGARYSEAGLFGS